MAFLGVLTHRKTRRLATALGVSQCFAVGVLETLWHVAQTQSKDGGIGRLSNQDIADEMFYDGNADALISSLVESGWVDEVTGCRLYIHDWHEHSTDTVDTYLARGIKTYANGALPRMKKLSMQDRAKLCAQYRTQSHEMPQPEPEPEPEPITNNQNQNQNQTGNYKSPSAPKTSRFIKPTPEEIHSYMEERGWLLPDGQKFYDSYEAKGWKIGRSLMKDWKATVRTWESSDWFKGKRNSHSLPSTSPVEAAFGIDWGIDPVTKLREAYTPLGEEFLKGEPV